MFETRRPETEEEVKNWVVKPEGKVEKATQSLGCCAAELGAVVREWGHRASRREELVLPFTPYSSIPANQ